MLSRILKSIIKISSRANSLVLPVVAQQSEVAKTKHDLLVSNDSRHFLTQQFGEFELEADEVQKHAAWSLYVELTTRVATQALSPKQGRYAKLLIHFTLFTLEYARFCMMRVHKRVLKESNLLAFLLYSF